MICSYLDCMRTRYLLFKTNHITCDIGSTQDIYNCQGFNFFKALS
ncbi:Uncharacterised protein [Mycobacterium tuberculosis]|uniref:Uncharacterized protein n=1 Tax=Mycobacterium tuberculosis TaxID=1773 RepID=A0A655AYA7_MYCTX|nr:Uncharacterised protein [Mycobacterium tuberculosis]CKU77073.1 Uncharacterised protein [Mycobacterium tuberculosis]